MLFPESVNHAALLHVIVTYIKENTITKLQKLYSPPRNLRAGIKSPMLFLKKPLYMGDLSPMYKILIERLAYCSILRYNQTVKA